MRIAVFAGSSDSSQASHRAAAADLGRTLALAGVAVVYGGGRVGLMGALADAALAAGGQVYGVIPQRLLDAELAHRGLTRLFVVDSMHERKQLMADLADGFCALPGGVGTLEELFEAWTWQLLGIHGKPVAVLDADGAWRALASLLDSTVEQGFLRAADRDSLVVVRTAAGLLPALAAWQPSVSRWGGRGPLESVGAVVLRDGAVLAARSAHRERFYLPGGKLEPGESHVQALRRELGEELGLELTAEPVPLTTVQAPADGEAGRHVRMHCFRVELAGEPQPRREIAELAWLTDPEDLRAAPALRLVLRYLLPDLSRNTRSGASLKGS